MLNTLALILAVLALLFFSFRVIALLLKYHNDYFSYCRNEEKKACNYEDYKYCDSLKI
ncbi:MAG: hypothetical protein PHO86_03665 [Bacilli bacterium]|nr:hypothetical protein [Bacilli bacterium]